MKTQQQRAQEKRQEKLDLIGQQIKDGSLTVRKMTAAEVKQRVHEHYHCDPHESLTQKAA